VRLKKIVDSVKEEIMSHASHVQTKRKETTDKVYDVIVNDLHEVLYDTESNVADPIVFKQFVQDRDTFFTQRYPELNQKEVEKLRKKIRDIQKSAEERNIEL